MSTHDPVVSPAEARSLAASLAPLLVEACRGRLSDITWFKADWQRGGAATATARWLDGGEGPVPVVLKLPVVQREYVWTQRMQPANGGAGVVPRLYAHGDVIGGYDLSWIVIERFEHGPIGLHWHEDHVPRIADAIARFYRDASRHAVHGEPRHEPWEELVAEAQKSVRDNAVEHEQQWKAALKALKKQLSKIVEEWESRPATDWIHGDLHLANAMSRVGVDDGEVSLIDLAEVRPGHWVEDAIYLERQLWARPERMKPHKPLKAIAQARKAHGLEVDEQYPRLAMIRRVLLAATAPKFIRSEGHPKHLEACLQRLEQGLQALK